MKTEMKAAELALSEDLEYIISGWFEQTLEVSDIKEMAGEIQQYILETYGPPF